MVPTVSSLLIPVSSSRPFSRNGASPQSFNHGEQFLFRFNFTNKGIFLYVFKKTSNKIKRRYSEKLRQDSHDSCLEKNRRVNTRRKTITQLEWNGRTCQ